MHLAPLRVCDGEAGRLDRSLSSVCLPFVLVSTGEKKKSFSIDLRAPTPPTPFDVDDAPMNFFFSIREKEERGTL